MRRNQGNGTFSNCILLILALVILYSGFRLLDSAPVGGNGAPAATKTITRDGVDYFPRQDIRVLMVLGIDQSGPVQSSHYYRNRGAADSILLLIFDETNEECRILSLNRDTMLHMDVLGVRGEYAGTSYGQLALAHTYGEGLEDSCENVKNTLVKFLPGLTVDCYLAMNMDALPILNDAVGGVTVNVVDDFSQVNPSISLGEVKLTGDQVIDFVRSRKDVGDQQNSSRMARQREYVDKFFRTLAEKQCQDIHFLADMYQAAVPYIVTDCSAETLSGMLSRYMGYTVKEIVSPEGETLVAEGSCQFHVDAQKLDALILRLFYGAQ